MNQAICKLLLGICITTLMISCKKGTKDTDTGSNNNTSSAKLKVAYLSDTTKTANFDTSLVFHFSYDANGRTSLVKVRDNIYSQWTYVEFAYNGNETRPYYYKRHQPGGISSTSYLFYDAEGYVKKDSNIFADINGPTPNRNVMEFSLVGSTLIYTQKFYTSPGTTPGVGIRSQQVQISNGNVTRQTETLPDITTLYENTFDTHVNPLYQAWPYHYRVPVATLSGPPYWDFIDKEFLLFNVTNKNNQLSHKKTLTPAITGVPSVAERKYTYSYDADGNPLIVRQETTGIPITVDGNRRYAYKFVYQ